MIGRWNVLGIGAILAVALSLGGHAWSWSLNNTLALGFTGITLAILSLGEGRS